MIEWNDITALIPSDSDQYTSRSNAKGAEVYRTWMIMLRLGYKWSSATLTYSDFWSLVTGSKIF